MKIYFSIILFVFNYLSTLRIIQKHPKYIVSKGYIVEYIDLSDSLTKGREFFYFSDFPLLDSTDSYSSLIKKNGILVNYYYYVSKIFSMKNSQCLNDFSEDKVLNRFKTTSNRQIKIYNVLITYTLKYLSLHEYLNINEQPHSYPFTKFENDFKKKLKVVNPEIITTY